MCVLFRQVTEEKAAVTKKSRSSCDWFKLPDLVTILQLKLILTVFMAAQAVFRLSKTYDEFESCHSFFEAPRL